MTEADFIAALRQHWITNGATVSTGGAVPVVALQLWEDDEGVPEPPVPYHRIRIACSGAESVSIGRTREETRGLVTVQIFAPHDGGPGPSERLASAVAAVWRTFRHPRVKLGAPSVATLKREGAFNRHLVTVGWRGDLRPGQQ